jgi:hypothetical protein
MNLKEHLQFLIMLIPTFLLLAAAVVTLALPAGSAREPVNVAQVQADVWE